MKRARGFTLLEVLVAFALLALALTVLLGSLSGATRQVGQAERVGRAALHGQSLLAGLGVEQPLRAGQVQGELEQGRYTWDLRIEPWRDPSASTAARQDPSAPRLLRVRLVVAWGEAEYERMAWDTLRLAASDPRGAPP